MESNQISDMKYVRLISSIYSDRQKFSMEA